MDTYKEYVIRCKTCNEQIACFASDYEALLSAGASVEEALNELGIMEYCSRIAMMNPTIVAFNMENRAVIEGFKSVDAVLDTDAQEESTSQPIFSACLGAGTLNPAINPLAAPQLLQNTMPGIRTQPNAPGQLTGRPQLPGIQTLGQIRPITAPILQGVTGVPIRPIIPDIDPEGDQPLGIGIPVNIPEKTGEFIDPVVVGVPTINPDPTIQQATIFVGAGKYVNVLNGRTYLAQ
jgi:DNA-directed RNA polymerase subunit N (RpoN/RPB10)